MKKLLDLSIILGLISCLILNSCNTDNAYQYSDIEKVNQVEWAFKSADNLNIEIKNELIEVYAFLLASSLGELDLRNVIKNEAQLRFDGDYDVLINRLESINLPSKDRLIKELLDSKFNEKFSQLSSMKIFKDTQITFEDYYTLLTSAFPNLQVAVPLHCDNWDAAKYVPLVAYIPCDFEDQNDEFVYAFNVYGEKTKLDTKNEPEVPVVVVGISERVNENGERISIEPILNKLPENNLTQIPNLKSAPSAPSGLTVTHGSSQCLELYWSDVSNETSYQIFRKCGSDTQYWHFGTTGLNDNDFINCWIAEGVRVSYKVRAVNADGYSAYSPAVTTFASGRTDGELLKIKRMKFSTSALRAVESWIKGAPEIRLRVVKGSSSGTAFEVFTSGILEPNRRNDIKDTWWTCNTTINYWYTSTYGTVLTFDWREEDPTSSATFSISGSWEDKDDNATIKAGGSIQITDDEGGDNIGLTLVHWWDSKSNTYNISGFEFEFE